MAKAKMTDEVRERLKAAAERNKGRKNLMGLDKTTGLVALDFVQEQDGERTTWILRADGTLEGTGVNLFKLIPCRHHESVAILPVHQKTRVHRYTLQCPWVRLSYAPQWLKDELQTRWPSKKIIYNVRDYQIVAPVFPLAVICEWFRFIWPDREDFAEKTSKYITGYSENYVKNWEYVEGLVPSLDADEPVVG